MSDYISSGEQEIQAMLQTLGLQRLDELADGLPEAVRLKDEQWHLPQGISEFEAMEKIRAMAAHNRRYAQIYRGAGAYRHYIPSALSHLASRSEFVTAYTPYQAEMSQGLLQTIFEYQTMICELTGLDVSNASVYDGATAATEAMLMCVDSRRRRVLVPQTLHPQILRVMQTYGEARGLQLVVLECSDGVLREEVLRPYLDDQTACLVVQQPNYYGLIEDPQPLFARCAEQKIRTVLLVNPIAAMILPSAAEVGAQIAAGEGQPLGMPLSFGGPYLGFMACEKSLMRRLPGRIVGQSTDQKGQRAYVLTLQAREQHIRREKASSSICSNQALCALRAAIYCSLMGTEGLTQVASQCVDHAHYLADQLQRKTRLKLKYDAEFFHEFVTVSSTSSFLILKHLEDHEILGGLPLNDHEILWCATEMNRREQIDHLVELIREVTA